VFFSGSNLASFFKVEFSLFGEKWWGVKRGGRGVIPEKGEERRLLLRGEIGKICGVVEIFLGMEQEKGKKSLFFSFGETGKGKG